MKKSSYQASLFELKNLLKNISLTKASYDKKGIFSSEFMAKSRRGNYIEIYDTIIQNVDYDILLFDDSVLQFSYLDQPVGNKTVRYAFYQFPFDILPYEKYLEGCGLSYQEVGEFFREDYEQEVAEAAINSNALTIRYDFSTREYTSAVHPASHFHIGLNNNFRLPIAYYITPLMFGIFLIKQIYYWRWKDYLKNQSFKATFEKCKNQCKKIEDVYFSVHDKKELYLF